MHFVWLLMRHLWIMGSEETWSIFYVCEKVGSLCWEDEWIPENVPHHFFFLTSNLLCQCSGLKVSSACAITESTYFILLISCFLCLSSFLHTTPPHTLLNPTLPSNHTTNPRHLPHHRKLHSDYSRWGWINRNRGERHDRKDGGCRHYISQDFPLNSMLKITLSAFAIRQRKLAERVLCKCTCFPVIIQKHTVCMTFKIYCAKSLTGELWLKKVTCELWHKYKSLLVSDATLHSFKQAIRRTEVSCFVLH